MKILVLLLFPGTYFALQKSLWRFFLACAPGFLLILIGDAIGHDAFSIAYTIARKIDMVAFLFGFYLVVQVIVWIWVGLSAEYKSFERLPKGTFWAILIPFVLFFRKRDIPLGIVCLLFWLFNWLPLVLVIFLGGSISNPRLSIDLLFYSITIAFKWRALTDYVNIPSNLQER
ncbi:hypothetical protein [Helicobacter cynogastricus]|uniref:hypothetical protein n=1 Tax=Helicobacter cynogastricus TaxID=329937 RepID=UPI000CF0B0B8|nr:hypothetical protein [Helicobacter cynogastricus]